MIHQSVGGDSLSTSSDYKSKWPPSLKGDGVSATGVISQVRSHSLKDESMKYFRFKSVVLNCSLIKNRIFEDEKELETQVRKEKLVQTGYLNKYDHKDVDDPDAISSHEFVKRLGGKSHPFLEGRASSLHPNVKDHFEFWGEMSLMKEFELAVGQEVKLKTKNDSILIETFAILKGAATHASYSGEDVIGGWTGKINVGGGAEEIPGEDLQGADDDEWD